MNHSITDCVFCVDLSAGDDFPQFVITPKALFEAEGKCDDCFDQCEGLPDAFGNTMESCWEFYGGDVQTGINALIAAGAEQSEPLWVWINKYGQ